MAAKEGQKPGADAESPTPGNFVAADNPDYKRNGPNSAFGKSGQPDNQSTDRGKGKT